MAKLRNPNAGKAMRRRDVIALLGGAVAWPVAARAQQRLRRIGVLASGLPADDPEWQTRGTAFVQALQQLGWTDGRNVRLDYRFGLGDPDRRRKAATDLVALAPDVLLAGGTAAVATLQQATRTVPIVFANVVDPIGGGFVGSLARPGGNTTGFMSAEFGISGKWLELLKEIARRVARAAIFRNPTNTAQVAQFAVIQGAAATPIDTRDAGEAERGLMDFARGPNGGLIVPNSVGLSQSLRHLIIALATRHRLPAVYSSRGVVTEGGLISYGTDQAEPYRL